MCSSLALGVFNQKGALFFAAPKISFFYVFELFPLIFANLLSDLLENLTKDWEIRAGKALIVGMQGRNPRLMYYNAKNGKIF